MPTFMDLARSYGDQQKMFDMVNNLKDEMAKEGMELDEEKGKVMRKVEQTEEDFLDGAVQACHFVSESILTGDGKGALEVGCLSADLVKVLESSTFLPLEESAKNDREALQRRAMSTATLHDCWFAITENTPLTIENGLKQSPPLEFWEFGGVEFSPTLNFNVTWEGGSPYACTWDTQAKLVRYTKLCDSFVEEVLQFVRENDGTRLEDASEVAPDSSTPGCITGADLHFFLEAKKLDFAEPDYSKCEAKMIVDVLLTAFEPDEDEEAEDEDEGSEHFFGGAGGDKGTRREEETDEESVLEQELWRFGRVLDVRPAWRWKMPWRVQDINRWVQTQRETQKAAECPVQEDGKTAPQAGAEGAGGVAGGGGEWGAFETEPPVSLSALMADVDLAESESE
jgi:hypothetical protein